MIDTLSRPIAPLVSNQQVLDWVADIKANYKAHLGAMLGAVAVSIYLVDPGIYSFWFAASNVLFWCYVILSKKHVPSTPVLVVTALILAFTWGAVPLSYFNPNAFFPQTVWLAVLTTVIVPLLFVKDVKPLMLWLTPVWVILSVTLVYEWYTTDIGRVSGFAENPNPAGGFLVLGCVYLLHFKKAKWLAPLLITTIPFTGSRLALLAAGLVLTGIFASRVVPWKYAALGLTTALVIIHVITPDRLFDGYVRVSPTTSGVVAGLEVRTTNDEGRSNTLSFLPEGYWDSRIHNVPVRMMYETGILSGVLWVLLAVYGLLFRPRFDLMWWLFALVVFLSLLDYYTWIGSMSWAWWLFLSQRSRRPEPAPS